METHYDTLQVAENASAEVTKGAYKYLIQKWHPDRNLENEELAKNMNSRVSEACSALASLEKSV